MPRPVDGAMNADRPQKRTVRRLWLEEVQRLDRSHSVGRVPLYLTLSGAEGKDIEVLAQNGIITLTQVHGISSQDQWKVVAVESSPEAVLQLQDRFPGLKIIEAPMQSLLRGDSQIRWPNGEDEVLCRAKIVNLDVDEPVKAVVRNHQIIFPLLEKIRKLAVIHAEAAPSEWVLLLTVHGECPWDESISLSVQQFLSENCGREPRFAERLRVLLGDDLFGEVCSLRVRNFSQLTCSQQQRVLMAFVPKKIASLVSQAWRIDTSWIFRYGGINQEAPMATWALSFQVDPRGSRTPDVVYKESIINVFRRVGEIRPDGTIQEEIIIES